jgi:predicted nucleotidyltransferase
VVRVGLFGSTARGEATERSDIDILLQFDPARKSLDAFMDAADILAEAFPARVEVLTTESLNPHMARSVLSEAEFYETRA